MKNNSLIVLLVIIFSFAMSCKKDNPTQGSSVDQVVSTLEPVPQPTEVSPPELLSEEPDGLSCTKKTYNYAPGYTEVLLMDPTSEIVYPGSILDAQSVTEGSWTPVGNLKRKPLTVSVSLPNLSGVVSGVIEKPTLSNTRQTVKEILQGEVTGSSPAFISYEIKEIYSEEHLALSLGLNIEASKFKLASEFDFKNDQIKSRFIVKYVQVYYTVDVDMPSTPSEWIENSSNFSLGDYVPIYVASVKYGREVMFIVESSRNSSEVSAALNSSFSAFSASASINVSAQQQQVLNESSIKALIVGGSSSNAAQVNSVTSLQAFLSEGGQWSTDNPGAALGFTLRLLSNNSVFKLITSGTFTVRECQILPTIDTLLVTIEPNSVTGKQLQNICFQHTAGDKDFGGDLTETGKIEIYKVGNNEVWAKIDATFTELGGDHSKGEIHEKYKLYSSPNGFEVAEILSDLSSNFNGTDADHSVDVFTFSTSELIWKAEANGDTDGDDIVCNGDLNSMSWVSFFLNPLKISIRQQ